MSCVALEDRASLLFLKTPYCFNFLGVKGAEVPLREVGDEYPLTETFYTKKEINIQTSGCKS